MFREINEAVRRDKEAYDEATVEFNEKERFYNMNRAMWKENKQYAEIRKHRWDKDEARKEQTRKKKVFEATKAKSKEHHLLVNYSSSEGNSIKGTGRGNM